MTHPHPPARRRGLAAGLALAACLVAAPGVAADAALADAAALDLCVVEAVAGEHVAAVAELECVGQVSGPCMDGPGAATNQGMQLCLARELAGWDLLLNRYWAVVKQAAAANDAANRAAGVASDAAGSLTKGQRGWIAFRDGQCAHDADLYAGGSHAALARIDCLNSMTARRAIDLMGLAAR